MAPANVDGTLNDEDESTIEKVEQNFEDLLERIRSDSFASVASKNKMLTEVSMMKEDAFRGDGNLENLAVASGRLGSEQSVAPLYAESAAPYCVISGKGPVGQAVVARLKAMGDAAQVRYLDGSIFGALTDSEIDYAVRFIPHFMLMCLFR